MKRKIVCLFAAVSLLFSGCRWLDGNYVSVAPHREQQQSQQTGVISAATYQELLDALEDNDDVQNVWHNWEDADDLDR